MKITNPCTDKIWRFHVGYYWRGRFRDTYILLAPGSCADFTAIAIPQWLLVSVEQYSERIWSADCEASIPGWEAVLETDKPVQ